jgi:hypothetical protein
MTQYRAFTDSSGTTWKVYRIEPQSVSPTLERLRQSLPHPPSERRRPWLLFESAAGEKRRLVPIPNGWDTDCTDAQLVAWCQEAERMAAGAGRRSTDNP